MKSEKPVRARRLPPDYAAWLTALKERVRLVQLKAATRVNRELILLYWDIGRSIVEAQRDRGYGKQVVERLAADLQEEFPGLAGFSPLNVWRMRAFYEAYAGAGRILSQAVTELASAAEVAQPRRLALGQKLSQPVTELAGTIGQQPVAQLSSSLTPAAPSIVSQAVRRLDASPPEPLASLPWGHNLLLLHKLKSRTDRLWYAQAAVEHGWSRSVLGMQIEQRAHRRAGRAVTNFAATLPPPQSDLAQQTLKDPYVFDFLTLDAAARERELEHGLADHIQKFLVSLGAGFAFVGRQVHLAVEDEDYYLDLLFYHLKLRCFVVIDLKMEAFKPEFAGKMNFYLSAVDAHLRHPDDQPSIGLLLCRGKNRLTVEYALRDLKKPIGVAEWRTRLVESLPKKLQGSLPTVAEIEAELGGEHSPKKGRR
jgi:predicted nuclease of restriction endonuclease-like (RecB) superfamily